MTEELLSDPVDRSGWPPGPWDQEPDRVEWRHAALPCLIVRSRTTGALCGYVGLPPGHPHHGAAYEDVDVFVHGGLTYSNACAGGICHLPQPGEPADVWWLGFDCAHADDLMPRHADDLMPRHAGSDVLREFTTYCDVGLVTAWVNELAEQLVRGAEDAPPPEALPLRGACEPGA
jgi:hypothetical protein